MKVTFRPLARGYYRCNQTGVKVKNCDAYRRSVQNQRRKSVIPKEAQNLPRVKLFNGIWQCPNSHNHYYWRSYENRSDKVNVIDYCGCGQRVFIVGKN